MVKKKKNRMFIISLILLILFFILVSNQGLFSLTDIDKVAKVTLKEGQTYSIGVHKFDVVDVGAIPICEDFDNRMAKRGFTSPGAIIDIEGDEKILTYDFILSQDGQCTSYPGYLKFGEFYKITPLGIKNQCGFDSISACLVDEFEAKLEMQGKIVPIFTNAPNILFTNQNYEMCVAFDAKNNIDGFIDVEYTFEGLPFDSIVETYDFKFKNINKRYCFPVLTQTEAKLNVKVKPGEYWDLDERYKIHYGTELNHNFLINPRPLWIDKSNCGQNCQECTDYTISTNGNYCIQDDLSTITCLQTGCPFVEGHEYMCMSSGYCAELIYKYINQTVEVEKEIFVEVEKEVKVLEQCQTDVQCEAIGGVCLTNANGQNYCVNEIISQEIIEKKIEIPTPVYIDKSCSEYNFCDETQGYTCVDKLVNDKLQATCERTIIRTITESINFTFLITGGIIISIIVFIIVIRRKR